MSGATEGTIAALLRHSGTVRVRRYAHLSPSHLQEEIEKVAAFGKPTDQQTTQHEPPAEHSIHREPVGEETPLISDPTVTRTVLAATQLWAGER